MTRPDLRFTVTPHWVYRLFDAHGNMLYAGCTANLGKRLAHHASNKDWWRDVRGIESERYPTFDAGRAAEQAVIAAHQPIYNLIHTERNTPAQNRNTGGWATRRAAMDAAHGRGESCGYEACGTCRAAAHAAGEPCARARQRNRCTYCAMASA